MQLDTRASGLSPTTVQSTVDAAFTIWLSPTTQRPAVAVSASTVDCSSAGASNTGQSRLCWRDLTTSSPGAIAITHVSRTRGSKPIV